MMERFLKKNSKKHVIRVCFHTWQKPYGHKISQPNINVDIWLRNRWFCNNDQQKINFSTYKRNLKSTNCQPNFNHLFQHWYFTFKLVNFWLNCGWEVDFWLIIATKSTISQPNINVEDGWGKLRLNVESTLISWSVPTGMCLGCVLKVLWPP